MHKFKGKIEIIGINPFLFVPEKILQKIFRDAGVEKGPIPVHGKLNDLPYKQTLVKYQGEWRLYINTTMLKDSPKRVGEIIQITIDHDPIKREQKDHPKFAKALLKNKAAKKVFDELAPSLQREIIRYISSLKTEASVDKNIVKAIDFLLGKGRFVGRQLGK